MQPKEKRFIIENNILKGIGNPSPDLKYTSLGEGILYNLNKDPDFVGQIDCITGEEWKYEKMRDRSVRCALWLKAQGLLPDDVVLICTHHRMDIATACYGTLFHGAIVNSAYEKSNKNEFCHLMNITKPKIAFVSEETAETFAQAAKVIKLDLKIVVFGRIPGFLDFESIIAEVEVDEVKDFKCRPIENPDKTALILTTSGTTGPVKAIALSHSVYLKIIMGDGRNWIRKSALIFSPLTWYTGTLNIIASTFTNGTRYVPPPYEEYTACEIIERYKITCIFMTPNMIGKFLKSDVAKKYDISSLKEVICGGAPLAIASRQAFAKLVPNAMLKIGYGMTEVGNVLSYQTFDSKLGSCGRICETAQVKVIDPTTGQALGPNQQGELLTKTNTMMSGYYNDPQATANSVDEEGWVHSGDIGYYDEDGEVYVVGRFKELIKYRGYNISPTEIEDILVTHPGVKEVVVVGLPHPVDKEHPIAFVVKTDSSFYNREVTEEELISFVAAEVSDRKRLRGGVKFVDFLPKTASNKIQRRDVRALARSMVAS